MQPAPAMAAQQPVMEALPFEQQTVAVPVPVELEEVPEFAARRGRGGFERYGRGRRWRGGPGPWYPPVGGYVPVPYPVTPYPGGVYPGGTPYIYPVPTAPTVVVPVSPGPSGNVVCPEGSVYNTQTGQCQSSASCPAYHYYDPLVNGCRRAESGTCAQGFYYDQRYNTCIELPTGQALPLGPTQSGQVCPVGFLYSSQVQGCVRVGGRIAAVLSGGTS